MNNSKLNILFVLDKINTNSKGVTPLRCRITYLKERKIFSTGLFINLKNWEHKKQNSKSPNKENIRIKI
ncbi:Arm DNA-binding domain-containing protein [Apibacter muscae]|uniref:Arm DNA-binding domain-containing protein n=1 Tax=Apibacter muscae TaxID=2509004 RepID=UPI0021AAEE7E|nr:Arm DNA-binding domain-containing protein [Apibacter muscae]